MSEIRQHISWAHWRSWLLGVVGLATLVTEAYAATSPSAPVSGYGNASLSFEINQGQCEADARFSARGPGYSLSLKPTEAVLYLRAASPPRDPQRKSAATARAAGTSAPPASAELHMRLTGANPAPRIEGVDRLRSTSSYFIGNDPARWHTGIANYAKVRYGGIYPGIDLIYYGNQRQLEYDFVIAPGADPARITLEFTGAKPRIDRDGNLVLATANGEVMQHKPVIYQDVDGVRRSVAGRYLLRGAGRVGFEVAAWDREHPLVIDPILVYGSYLGGSGDDAGLGVALDNSGNVYLMGQEVFSGSPKVFVTKFDTNHNGVYSVYFGGSDSNTGSSIAIDAAGNAYITGDTSSRDFPTTAGALHTTTTRVASGYDGFVTKLDPSGSVLIYSTYLGGSSNTSSAGIAVDVAGTAYVTGTTTSNDFPTTPGAWRTTPAGEVGEVQAFVTKLNAMGSALVYGTYLGGKFSEGYGIAVDGAGNVYVTGLTDGADFPTTPGALRTSPFSGISNGFVAKLNPAGSALVYSTYLGEAAVQTFPARIALDGAGNAYIASESILPSATTVYVAKLNPVGSALVYTKNFGGTTYSFPRGMAVDDTGNAYITGETKSTDFQTTAGAVRTTLGGSQDAFVVRLDASGQLIYGTFLGGTRDDLGYGIAVDNSGHAFVTGATDSTDFPLYGSNAGGYDAFIAEIATSPFTVTATAVGNGTITPSTQQVYYGDYATGTLTLPEGVAVSLSSDICSVGVSGVTWTAGTIGQDCHITATFTNVSPAPLPNPNLQLGGSGVVNAVVRTSDGGAVFGGRFTSVDGNAITNLAKLKVDGTLDTSWNPSPDAEVDALVVDKDGNVYVGGEFLNIGGQTRNHLAKISAAGTVDTGWNPSASSGVYALAVDINGNVYAGGGFVNIGGQACRHLAKISAAGTADPNWDFPANNAVYALAVDAGGNVYVGGGFNTLGGQSRKRIGRISAAGALDSGWDPSASGEVDVLVIGKDENVYVGGGFQTIGGLSRGRLARISTTGTVDPNWNPSANGDVFAFAIDTDGSVYAGGDFAKIGGQTHSRIAKISGASTGTVDPDWNPSPNSDVNALAIDTVGKLYVGGAFTRIGGENRQGIAAFGNVFIVTATANGNGTITPATQTVSSSGTASFTVTPSSGYGVNVNGDHCAVTQGIGNTWVTGPITQACVVTATFMQLSYTVTATAIGNGTITPATQTVNTGGTASFTVMPASGYSVGVSGDHCTVTQGTGNTWIAGPITEACAVTATFAQLSYTVTATAIGNGTIAPATQSVNSGGTATFTVVPAGGYSVDVSGDHCTVTQGTGNAWTTGPITQACAVTATFTQLSYTVTATANGNGTITPATQTVNSGGTASFTVTPASGYSVGVSGDHCTVTQGTGNAWTTGPITQACAVTATFTQLSYTVTATANGKGTITPATQTVNSGGTASFTVTPASGYSVGVSGDHCAVTQGTGNTWTTGPITQTCAVTAVFKANLPPVANPVTVNVTSGTPTSVVFSATDANLDSGTFVFEVASPPSHGTVSLSSMAPQATGSSATTLGRAQAISDSMTVVYTSNPGYAGSDSFTFTASDANGTSAPAQVTITVFAATTSIVAAPALSAWMLALLAACLAGVAGLHRSLISKDFRS